MDAETKELPAVRVICRCIMSATSRGIIRALLAVVATLLLLSPALSSIPAGLQCSRQTVDDVYMNIIDVDLNDPSILVTPVTARDSGEKRETFKEFHTSHHPLAQITGSFFDLHSGQPIGDVVVHGKSCFVTAGIGSALVVKPDNSAAIIDSPPSTGWAGYESVLQGGARLVRDGLPACDPLSQGFHDRYMQRLTSRIVVGLWPSNHLAFISTGHVLLPDLANILVKMGCQDAMALDGGGSTGIAFNGKQFFSSGRKLSNVLMVLRRSPAEVALHQQAVQQAIAQAAQQNAPPPAPGGIAGFFAATVSCFQNLGAIWPAILNFGSSLAAQAHPPVEAITSWFSHWHHPDQPPMLSRG